jgi:hypothetical protein
MIKKILCVLLLNIFLCSTAQVNLDFESMSPGGYSIVPGWNLGVCNYTSQNGFCSIYTYSLSTYASIVSTPISIPGGTPSLIPNSPLGGSLVAHFNGGGVSNGAQQLTQTFTVTPSNQILQYAYMASMLGGDHNNCCASHYFKISVVDCSSNPVPNASLSVLPTTTLCSNTGTMGMLTPTPGTIYHPNWMVCNVNLGAYIGSCITIIVEPGMCLFGGHYPDLYFDCKTSASLIQPSGGNMVGNNYVVCNNSATLTSLPANSYTWSGPGGFSSNNQSIVTSTAGPYVLTTSNIGGNVTQTLNLVVGNTPTINIAASNQTICTGMSVTLTANGVGINTYSWNTGATTSSIIVTPSVSSVYTVTANSGTCPATATVAVQVSGCVGIQKNIADAASGFKIYPNPNKGNFTVQADKEETLYIYDQLGKLLREIKLNQGNNFSVSLSGFSEGIYLLTNKVSVRRIVVIE